LTVPVRTCVACRQRDERANLVRYVLVDGALERDDRARLPGRGAWVHEACVETAQKRGAFNRALRRR